MEKNPFHSYNNHYQKVNTFVSLYHEDKWAEQTITSNLV